MTGAADERLRQEREAFDLNKAQSIDWFRLQLLMGYLVLGILIVIALACLVILLAPPDRITAITVGLAGGVLFGDLIGLAVLAVKLVLSPVKRPILEPVTSVTPGQQG